MKPRLVVLLALVLLLPMAAAHAPRVDDGGDVVEVGDATKSWAFYGSLEAGGVDRYAFEAREGERILLSLYVPAGSTFRPHAMLLTPEGPRDVPAYPQARASFEPFTPQAFLETGALDTVAPASGEYELVVTGEGGGAYGLALGYRESFTAREWLLTPASLVAIHVWEGQPLLLVLAPQLAGLAGGVLAAWRRRAGPRSVFAHAAAGILLGSGCAVLVQLLHAMARAPAGGTAFVTLAIALIAIALGAWAWALARRDATPARRAQLVLVALLATLSWSGLLVGPLLALAAAAMPERLGALRRRGAAVR